MLDVETIESLPAGWVLALFGDIAKVQGGYAFKAKEFLDSGIPVIRIGDLQDGFVTVSDKTVFLPVEYLEKNPAVRLQKGDILMALSGATTGKTAVFNNNTPALLNQRVGRFLPLSKENIDQNFLQILVKNISEKVLEQAWGGAQPNVSPRKIEQNSILLPPLSEQKRIATKIDALQAKSKKAREALEAARPLLDKLRQSILAAAFRGDLTADWRKQNPDVEPASKLLERIRIERRQKWEETELAKMRAKGKEPKNDKWKARYKEPEPVDTADLPELPEGWCRANTNQLFRFVTSGSRGWAKYYSTEGDLFIRIGNLGRDNIDINLSDIQYVQPPEGTEGTRTQVQPNDILISITADVGITSIVPDELPTAYINQHVALSRPATALNARYIAWFISSQNGQKQFEELKRGATKAGLGLDDIRSVMVSLPTYLEQCEIVRQIEKQFLNVAKIKQTIDCCHEDTRQLDQSILAKAFRGELVPQDPNDEPASVLLERIKAERATQQLKRKQKKSKKKGVA